MKISIELSEENIRAIITEWINKHYHVNIEYDQLHIEVKSKQNYRSTWEIADIRVSQVLIPKDFDEH
jgi:hypothetical protein